ncbi:MAG: 2-C-methyl-D-erythritol 2,4-cyclodiphosphate synthase [Candidatus Omnitrophota bacterium]
MKEMRIGVGYDIHKLDSGCKMVLGGINLASSKGSLGHSDGDVLIHAICDAILGALGECDIGIMFPDTNSKYKNADSVEFLYEVKNVMRRNGCRIINLDSVVICEEPKIAPYREKIINKLSDVLEVSSDRINVKGKTSEKLGDIGAGNAIESQVVVLLEKG